MVRLDPSRPEYCEEYLVGKLSFAWKQIEAVFGINLISLRGAAASADHLIADLNWDDMDTIVEKTGIGSSDAMIINLLNQSKYCAVITLDEDIIFAVQKIGSSDKFVIFDHFGNIAL